MSYINISCYKHNIMEAISYSDIKDQCLELDAYLHKKNKDKLTLVKEINETLGKHRVASFTDFIRDKLPHLEVLENYLPSPSSDEVSDLVSNDEEEEKRKVEKGFYSTVLYDKIEALLIDSKTLVEAVGKDTCKNLMLQGIPESLDYFEFVKFKDTLRKHPPNFYAVHFCFYESKYSLVLEFDDSYGAQRFYDSCRKRELPNFTQYLGDKFDLKWIENSDKIKIERKHTLERKLYDAAFSLRKKPKSLNFYSEDFVGVILRNVPSNYDCSEIVSLLGEKNVKAEISQVCKYSGEIFVLLQFNSIEEAELAVFFLHLKVISGHEMKACIHKKSNYFRRPEKQKYFKDIFVIREYDEDKLGHIIETLEQKDKQEKIENDIPESPYTYITRGLEFGESKKTDDKDRRTSHVDRIDSERHTRDVPRQDNKRPNYNRDNDYYMDKDVTNKRYKGYDNKHSNYRKDSAQPYNHYKKERKRSRSRSGEEGKGSDRGNKINRNSDNEQLESSLSLSSSRSREKATKKSYGQEYNRSKGGYRGNHHGKKDFNYGYNRNKSNDYLHR